MFRAAAVLLVFMASAIADTRHEPTLRRTFDAVQGNWHATSMIESGNPVDAKRLSEMSSRFDADVMTRSSSPEEAVRLSIDVTKTPFAVEWLDRHGRTTQGVLQAKDGRIDMCYTVVEFNGERTGLRAPTDFQSTPANKATRIAYERKSPPGGR